MKWFKLLIFTPIVLVSMVIANKALSDESAVTKEMAIDNLIKIENENKALHFGIRDLSDFSKAIEGENRLNCLEKRCIREGHLRIKITGPPEDTPIYVDLGGSSKTIRVNQEGNALEFYGTLGDQFVGQIWANACHGQRLTRLALRNNGHSVVRVDAIELILDNGNNVVKTIFKDEQLFMFGTGREKIYTIAEIKNNSAYRSARVASCQD